MGCPTPDPMGAASAAPRAPVRWDSLPGPKRRHLQRTIRALRQDHGLSYPAIVAVLDLYEGVALTIDQVRYRVSAMGLPKNPNMSRAA